MRGALPLTCLLLASALGACGEKPEPAIVAPRTTRSPTTAAPSTAAFETSYRREVCQAGQPDRQRLGARTARGVLALKDAQGQLALVPAARRTVVRDALERTARYYTAVGTALGSLAPPPGAEAAKRFAAIRMLVDTHAASLGAGRRAVADAQRGPAATTRIEREVRSLTSGLDALGVPPICVIASGEL